MFEKEFPTDCSFLRGAAASVRYRWSDKLMSEVNNGDCHMEEFVHRNQCEQIIRTDGKDFGFPNSKTISFE